MRSYTHTRQIDENICNRCWMCFICLFLQIFFDVQYSIFLFVHIVASIAKSGEHAAHRSINPKPLLHEIIVLPKAGLDILIRVGKCPLAIAFVRRECAFVYAKVFALIVKVGVFALTLFDVVAPVAVII